MMEILTAGPGITVQDSGRPGWLSKGLSRGGALDWQALAEGAALLALPEAEALEIPGVPLTLRVATPRRIALTGAAMIARAESATLAWHSSHLLPAGTVLTLAPPPGHPGGGVSYLTPAGGVDTPLLLGARSAHLAASLGAPLRAGPLALRPDPGGPTDRMLSPAERFSGGTLRITESLQTPLFSKETQALLAETAFTRSPQGNRMALRLASGPSFATEGARALLSDITRPGDLQVTGDGVVTLLMAECQTTGGYPRIATVLPCDLPRAAQAPVGATLRFRWVSPEEGRDAMRAAARPITTQACRRDLATLDLHGQELISGVINAHDPEAP